MPYNLRDDYYIDRILASASSSMGALNHFCKDTYVALCRKYLIFLAIIINILLWECKSWSLLVSLLNKLEVLLHRSIRRILGVTITQGKEDRITIRHGTRGDSLTRESSPTEILQRISHSFGGWAAQLR